MGVFPIAGLALAEGLNINKKKNGSPMMTNSRTIPAPSPSHLIGA